MSIDTPEELEKLKAAGRVVAAAIRAMRKAVRPGVSTRELDRIGGTVFREAGARSGPQLDYGFPGFTCISVNDEAVHGIPGRRRLQGGDLVKLDVTAELDGFYADACLSVTVGQADHATRSLVSAAQAGLSAAIRVARAGTPLNAIGHAVETTVAQRGFAVCAALSGHGIGRRIHEPPDVLNHFVPGSSPQLTDGLVITIEPIIAAGSGVVVQGEDGWTMLTADASRSAHAEHTIVITDGYPIVLTA